MNTLLHYFKGTLLMLAFVLTSLSAQATPVLVLPPVVIPPPIFIPPAPPPVPEPLSYILQIQEDISSFSRNPWYCSTDCNAGHEFGLAGLFEVTLDSWASTVERNRIRLSPLAVTATLPQGLTFQFPDYAVPYGQDDFSGNGDPCNYWRYSGTCLSIGNFGYYAGNFDGTTLVMQGASAIDYSDSYHYELTARVVPGPATLALILPALILLLRRPGSK